MIKVLLADDHQIMVDGLLSLLDQNKEIEVISTAKNGNEAVDFIKSNDVDVAVLDINMPEKDGVEATKEIRRISPETKVVILTMYNEVEFIKELTEIGCSGYILKNKGREELVTTIKKVYKGERHLGSAVLNTLIEGNKDKTSTGIPVKLTKREIQVLKLIAKEYTTPEIAEELFIATTTVDTHRRNLIGKLGVKSSMGLVRYAIEKGYVR